MLVRGIYSEAWDSSGKPVRERLREQFLARVQAELRTDLPMDPEAVARAVLRVLSELPACYVTDPGHAKRKGD